MNNTITIRNMVCDRCKSAVQRLLDQRGLPWVRIDLGEVELKEAMDDATQDALRVDLRALGFDLVLEHDAQVINKVKSAIIEQVHHIAGKRLELIKLVQDTVHLEFSSVSKLFSEVEGITMEHFFLLQRLERVKELIRYGELTFSEIAFATGFSSAAHLSAQFKQLTGMTPTSFRGTHGSRSPLDRVGKR